MLSEKGANTNASLSPEYSLHSGRKRSRTRLPR
jgi:hypothetical protein